MKRKIVIAIFVMVLGIYLLSMSAKSPNNLGVSGGKLSPIPDSPNAVSTQTKQEGRAMAALSMGGTATGEESIAAIAEIVKQLPRTHIAEQSENYLHVEFTSLIFRFVDDVEFYADEAERVVHFRSASRVGHSDLGANQRRMSQISDQWNAR